ncbi:ISAs1 family transposase [Hymenobacter siberiensis]|uniref:ISAs1 family transposase n=1 Tax=Hymenobacter siberiensis TaxID=2848396 RepID=UPI003742EAB4
MNFFASFDHLTDPRVQGRCRHQFVDILALLLCGTLAGCDDLPEICDYGVARLAFLRAELGLSFANGIPSTDTLERMMQALRPSELETVLRTCAGALAGRQLCVDGKEHRATTPAGRRHALIRTVSAWVADAGLSFGQVQIGGKTNEKTAIPALLGVQPKLSLFLPEWVAGFNALSYQVPPITHRANAHGQDPLCAVVAPALPRPL